MISLGGHVAVVATFAVVKAFAVGVGIKAVRNPESTDVLVVYSSYCLSWSCSHHCCFIQIPLNLSSMLW
jgi:hypothetical protein